MALDGTSDDDGDIIAAAAAADAKPVMVVAPEDRVTIDVDDLQDYVGQRPFPRDRMYPTTPAGAPPCNCVSSNESLLFGKGTHRFHLQMKP